MPALSADLCRTAVHPAAAKRAGFTNATALILLCGQYWGVRFQKQDQPGMI